ncbi:MAG: hypothetical protein Q4G09_01820 [Clostridia bacterium]|nr:hypothetical protein [Clostridia bacterium]
MIKTIAKEIGIVILLLIAVTLILGILFYDYIPTNKTIPTKIETYKLSEEIETELVQSMSDGQNIVRTYYIDSSDLSSYEITKEYNKGKANPFADYTVNATTQNNTTNSNNTIDNNGQNKNDSEVFFNTTGK